MKAKSDGHSAVQDLCRKLKIQLDELAVVLEQTMPAEDPSRRTKLLEELKQQIAELSR